MRLNLWPSADIAGVNYLNKNSMELQKLVVMLGKNPENLEVSLSRNVAKEAKAAKAAGRKYTTALCGGYQYIGDTLCIDIDDKKAGVALNKLANTVGLSMVSTSNLGYDNLLTEASKLLTYAILSEVDWDKYNLRKYGDFVEAYMYLFANSMYRMGSSNLRKLITVVPDPYTLFEQYVNYPEKDNETSLLELFDSVCYRICTEDCSFCAYYDNVNGTNRKLTKLDTIIAELERAYRRNNGQFV